MQFGKFIHKVEIQKLNHAEASGWQTFVDQPVRCVVVHEGDLGDGHDGYRVEMAFTRDRARMKGALDLGYAFKFLWSDPMTGSARELVVRSATVPTSQQHRTSIVFQCAAVQQNSES